ncbi:hypothetical protein JCGZ_22498 [Jatropha curcas]|uniref:Aminotransferase-like plant mobile domain-containing protein n=1 Tax=Jatropha curcas TaxID=180498 RepID=A0A067LIX9_JATCU|nr:hypothetical protein JCGZ_22498 [Jatropha curcas]
MIAPIRLYLFAAVEFGNTCRPLWRAPVESWWDTIDNFHTAIREWTITPFEFVMLTGIHFDSRPLDVDSAMVNPKHLADLIEFTLTLTGGLYRRGTPKELLRDLSWGAPLHMTWGSHGSCLCVVSSRPELAREYEWDGAFMASMYHDMSQCSRHVRIGLGGTVAIWEHERAIWHSLGVLGSESPRWLQYGPCLDEHPQRLIASCGTESQRRVPYFDLWRTTHFEVPRILPDDWLEYPTDELAFLDTCLHLWDPQAHVFQFGTYYEEMCPTYEEFAALLAVILKGLWRLHQPGPSTLGVL